MREYCGFAENHWNSEENNTARNYSEGITLLRFRVRPKTLKFRWWIQWGNTAVLAEKHPNFEEIQHIENYRNSEGERRRVGQTHQEINGKKEQTQYMGGVKRYELRWRYVWNTTKTSGFLYTVFLYFFCISEKYLLMGADYKWLIEQQPCYFLTDFHSCSLNNLNK